MEIFVISVGSVGSAWRGVLDEYERRASRYFRLSRIEVRQEPGRGRTPGEIQAREGTRLLERVPAGLEVVALTRGGEPWSSERLAEYIGGLMTGASPGAAFLVGGAFGLGDEPLGAGRRLSLSLMTLPHEMALVFLLEQVYRAGTILRGEPYHKGTTGRTGRGE